MKEFVLALGYFDSIHIGHRFLLQKAKDFASEKGLSVFVATFNDGFLDRIGRQEKEIYLLHQRKMILQKLGITETLIFPASKEFLNRTKEEFCAYIITLKPYAVMVGSDYSFGRNAEGKVDFLRTALEKAGIRCFIVDLLEYKEKKVSSTSIRNLISEGFTEEANLLLGEPYFVCGTILRGRQDGTKMGIPTINLAMNLHKQYPKSGVYVTETEIEGKTYPSVTNVGNHPTFSDSNENVETHILEPVGDVYGKTAIVRFYKYIRPIETFDNADRLKKQIENDIQTTKEYFYDKIRCGRQQ